MKFVHIADMHFDAPFTSLNAVENLGEKRRLEQRNAFKKVIDFIEKDGEEVYGDLGTVGKGGVLTFDDIVFINIA